TVDGADHLISETSTADPNHPVEGSTFVPKESFPSPLAFTWSTTKGADLSWVPIGFEKSFRMAYGRTHYGTGYYIFHRYVPGTRLSQEISAWKGEAPAGDVVELLSRAGGDPREEAHDRQATRIGVEAKSAATLLNVQGEASVIR